MWEGPLDLPGHLRGVIRLHATNFIQITKQEMCHDITSGIQVKAILRHNFQADILQLTGIEQMR